MEDCVVNFERAAVDSWNQSHGAFVAVAGAPFVLMTDAAPCDLDIGDIDYALAAVLAHCLVDGGVVGDDDERAVVEFDFAAELPDRMVEGFELVCVAVDRITIKVNSNLFSNFMREMGLRISFTYLL